MSRDPLQQSMVEDFHKILMNSSNAHRAWHNLPAEDKQQVENAFLEWAWQISLAAGDPKVIDPADYKAFGGFVLKAQKGRPTVFKTSDWVAMDRKSYDQVLELAHSIHDALVELKEEQEAKDEAVS